MKTVGAIIGYAMWTISGLLMFIFWLVALHKWLGLFGLIIAFVGAPGVVIFPLIFWLVEGVFPVFYFMVWGVGISGLIITGFSTSDE